MKVDWNIEVTLDIQLPWSLSESSLHLGLSGELLVCNGVYVTCRRYIGSEDGQRASKVMAQKLLSYYSVWNEPTRMVSTWCTATESIGLQELLTLLPSFPLFLSFVFLIFFPHSFSFFSRFRTHQRVKHTPTVLQLGDYASIWEPERSSTLFQTLSSRETIRPLTYYRKPPLTCL